MGYKAVIFDMDGVLIDTEKHWVQLEDAFLENLLGKEVAAKLGNTTGISIQNIYKKAVELGHIGSQKDFEDAFDVKAQEIYRKADISAGTVDLIEKLLEHNFKIGIVSASPLSWIQIFLDRVPFGNSFDIIISLHERSDLSHKPHPDGYNAAMKNLGVLPSETHILEDSNPGIAAAKASGAYVIALEEHLVPGYMQSSDAHSKAKRMADVWSIIEAKI